MEGRGWNNAKTDFRQSNAVTWSFIFLWSLRPPEFSSGTLAPCPLTNHVCHTWFNTPRSTPGHGGPEKLLLKLREIDLKCQILQELCKTFVMTLRICPVGGNFENSMKNRRTWIGQLQRPFEFFTASGCFVDCFILYQLPYLPLEQASLTTVTSKSSSLWVCQSPSSNVHHQSDTITSVSSWVTVRAIKPVSTAPNFQWEWRVCY